MQQVEKKQPDDVLAAWELATFTEKVGMLAMLVVAGLSTLWVFSPNFRGAIKAGLAILFGNSAAKDLSQTWKRDITRPAVDYVNRRHR